MNTISAVSIAKLIEAHLEGNEEKFLSYAQFIADMYKKAGKDIATQLIMSRLDGSYKNQPTITLDDSEVL